MDQMERVRSVRQAYEKWMELQGKVDNYYHDKPQERIPLSQQKDFRSIKNAVIKEADRINMDAVTFEDKGIRLEDEPEEFNADTGYEYWSLRDVIRDEYLTLEEREDAVAEMERLGEDGNMYAQYGCLDPQANYDEIYGKRGRCQGWIDCVSFGLLFGGAAVCGFPYGGYVYEKRCLPGEYFYLHRSVVNHKDPDDDV